MSIILENPVVPATTIWTVLSNFVTISSVGNAVALSFAAFLVWRTGTTKRAQAISRQNEAAYKALSDGLDAATKRADAERDRADAAEQLCSVWEVKNAELVRSATSDQTKFLLTVKTLTTRIMELEKAQGIHHDFEG